METSLKKQTFPLFCESSPNIWLLVIVVLHLVSSCLGNTDEISCWFFWTLFLDLGLRQHNNEEKDDEVSSADEDIRFFFLECFRLDLLSVCKKYLILKVKLLSNYKNFIRTEKLTTCYFNFTKKYFLLLIFILYFYIY